MVDQIDRLRYIEQEDFQKVKNIFTGKSFEKEYNSFEKSHKAILESINRNKLHYDNKKKDVQEFAQKVADNTILQNKIEILLEFFDDYDASILDEIKSLKNIIVVLASEMKILYNIKSKLKQKDVDYSEDETNRQKFKRFLKNNSDGFFLQKDVVTELNLERSQASIFLKQALQKEFIEELPKEGKLKKYKIHSRLLNK